MVRNHSVTLDSEKCVGCTDCIKRCPTEAIRVRNSKAEIIDERCIDCGVCIRVCKRGAKKAITDPISLMDSYKYKIAVPAPSLYAQFKRVKDVSLILTYLKKMGFDDVIEVAQAAQVISDKTQDYFKDHEITSPVISSACPVIVRLIQRRFPSLLKQILPLVSPMELAARYTREKYMAKGIKSEDIGIFFISPCAAKATDVRRPKGFEKSEIDGVFAIRDIYLEVIEIRKNTKEPTIRQQSSKEGIAWAMRGGINSNTRLENHILVDGIDSVISVLEKVEDKSLADVDYIEALACVGGCLGGPLTVEDPFVAKNYLEKAMEKSPEVGTGPEYPEQYNDINVLWEKDIETRPVFSLNDNMKKALEMMEAIDKLYNELPKIDCGSCGSPTCKSFAEDVVKGLANVEECVFMLRKKIKELSVDMLGLTQEYDINLENRKGGTHDS